MNGFVRQQRMARRKYEKLCVHTNVPLIPPIDMTGCPETIKLAETVHLNAALTSARLFCKKTNTYIYFKVNMISVIYQLLLDKLD